MESVGPRDRIRGVVYQPTDRLKYYADAGVLTQETLASAFRDAVRRWPDRTAVSELDCVLSFRDLDILTDKAASALLRLGLRPLDRVLFQLPNSKELVIAVVACLKVGLIPVCTLAAHRGLEIGYIGRHSGARAHFIPATDPRFDYVAFARDMRTEIPSLAFSIAASGRPDRREDGLHDLDSLIEHEDAAEARARVDGVNLDPFQVAFFQLSGGTTGVPKIIPRFNNEYLYTVRTVVACHGLDEDTVAFTPNPMMHNAPMACIWAPALLSGGEVAVSATLDPAVVGALLAQRKPNWMILPPAVLFRLLEAGWRDRIDFSNVRGFSITGGVARYSSFVGGAPTWPIFGMTEGLLSYCNASDPPEAVHTTVGRPLSPFDEVRLLRPESEDEVAAGDVGELVVRGPCTTRGYFDAEERNQVAFTTDGFYRSGDLVRFREIGGQRYLVFEGRIKDVVDRGGEKINCEEVERVAIEHPSIGAIAIVGMPDATYGERACAYVIPTAANALITAQELGTFLSSKGLAKFKWPERIEIVSDFPMTSAGKLSKPRLKEMIREQIREETAHVTSHVQRRAPEAI